MNREFEAVVFDMDGVISDTQKTHAQVESELLSRYGVKISPQQITDKYAGQETKKFFGELLTGSTVDIDELMNEKWLLMDEEIVKNGVDEIDGSIDLINSLNDGGIPLAVASASPRVFIERVLSNLSITNSFSAYASAEEVACGKPSPDVFLLAADRLGVVATNCIVIEDGISGMIGARAAGMKCVGLIGDSEFKNTDKYPADALVHSLRELSASSLRQIVETS